MGRRILNDALRSMVNAEKRGKAMVELKPISTVISSFLQIMKHRGNIPNTALHFVFNLFIFYFIFTSFDSV
jgi:small subunit ribosomal protein S15Ae